VTYNDGDGFTAWGVKIWAPGEGARNTDGIDPGNSTNITIAHCFLHMATHYGCVNVIADDFVIAPVLVFGKGLRWGGGCHI
jgi:polygalacturonase